MVPLYQSVLSGLLIGFKGEIAGSLGVDPKKTIQYSLRICLNDLGSMIFNHVIYIQNSAKTIEQRLKNRAAISNVRLFEVAPTLSKGR